MDETTQLKTGVYCIRNLVNGKRYVGSAAHSLAARMYEHKRILRLGTHCNQHLQRAWNRYGEYCFEFSILELCEPDKCVAREQHYIDHFDSANNQHGYNKAPKAGSQLGFKHSPETRKRIAELNRIRSPESRARHAALLRGRKHSEETKAKRAAALRKAWVEKRAGYKHSEEVKKKMSLAKKGKPITAKHKENIRLARLRMVRSGWTFSKETRQKMSESAKRHRRRRQKDAPGQLLLWN